MRCQAALARAERAIVAADAAIGQWQLHVDAMTALVAGSITHERADKLWATSKVRSKEKVRAFRDADERYRTRPDCAAPGGAGTQCETTRLARANQALTEARTAVAQWEQHIRAMDAEAAGELTPQQVTAKWVPLWEAGRRQIPAYAKAAGAHHDITGCRP